MKNTVEPHTTFELQIKCLVIQLAGRSGAAAFMLTIIGKNYANHIT